MKAPRFLVLLFSFLLFATACGGGNEGSDPAPADSDQTSAEDSDSDVSTDGGGEPMSAGDLPNSVPDDFPIAIPSGWLIDANEEIGLTASSTRLLYAADDFDAIVAFYDEWTAAQPDEYNRGDGEDGFVVFTRIDSPPYQISITPNWEERDQTWTILQASGSAGG